MDFPGEPSAGGPSAGPAAGAPGPGAPGEETLATGLAAALEPLFGLFRSLNPPGGPSPTAVATLTTLERSGPCRLTWLATSLGVTQPAMTQAITRLQEAGLVERADDPTDGRVVQISITADGRALLARRRTVRAERLAGLLAQLSPDERAALAAALPALETLASVRHDDAPAPAGQVS